MTELEARAREAIVRAQAAVRDDLPPVGQLLGLPLIVDELMPEGAVAVVTTAGVRGILLFPR